MDVNFTLKDVISFKGQLITLAVTTLAIAYIFSGSLSEFRPSSKSSYVLQVTPEVIKKWGHEPAHVKTGFYWHEFINFDVVKNDFLINAIIWFDFDPTKVKLEDIEKFSFTKGSIHQKSAPLVKKISDTLTYVEYNLRIQFNSIFDYSRFPLDDHKIYLNLINNSVDAQDVVYDVAPDDYVVPEYVFLGGWGIASHDAAAGYTQYLLSKDTKETKHPKILFSLGIKKQDFRELLLLFLPVFFIFCFSILTLSPYFPSPMGSMLSLVTAFMAYTIVVAHMVPDVGYFILIDYLMLFLLLSIFVIFLINFLGALPPEIFSKEKFEHIKSIAQIVICIALVIVSYYLANVFMLGA